MTEEVTQQNDLQNQTDPAQSAQTESPDLNVADLNQNKYFLFCKFRSSDGNETGLRIAMNGTENFFPITSISDTTMGWYRFQINDIKFFHFIESSSTSLYIQMNNTSCEIEQFVISSNPDFVPGPYPNYSYV